MVLTLLQRLYPEYYSPITMRMLLSISTHLISDIEKILVKLYYQRWLVTLHSSVDDIRVKEGKSNDTLFGEVFRCLVNDLSM